MQQRNNFVTTLILQWLCNFTMCFQYHLNVKLTTPPKGVPKVFQMTSYLIKLVLLLNQVQLSELSIHIPAKCSCNCPRKLVMLRQWRCTTDLETFKQVLTETSTTLYLKIYLYLLLAINTPEGPQLRFFGGFIVNVCIYFFRACLAILNR